MEIVSSLLLILHLLGMAIIIGAYFAHVKNARVIPGMVHASYLQLVTGLLMVGLVEMNGGSISHVAVGIKIVLGILVWLFAFLGKRKEKAAQGAGGLAEGEAHPSALMAHLTFAAALVAVVIGVTML
ncbi:hypothetical protein [Brevibacterium samyangense]|uniref:Integral membrane protein n=1 Tax=Brevibacterium samyangense TaxID=366888 RepID=A0ABN2TNV7_9MICO